MKRSLRQFFEKVGQYNQLVSDYKKATDAAPDHAMAHVNWGIELALGGNMPEALVKFETAAAMAPNRWEVFTNWGVALAKVNRFDEAIEKFQAALTLAPQAVNNYVLWGAALIEQGQTDAAMAQYQKAIELAPENPEPYINWGIALARTGDYFGALRQFRAALDLNTYQPQVFFLWGAVLAELEDYETAIDKFKTTLRFLPKHADSYYFWSVALNRMGRYEEALNKSKQAIQLGLERPEVFLNQGDILANLGKLEAALANYHHAITLEPTLAEGYLSWGTALCKLGQSEEGIEKLTKAQELNPNLIGISQQFGQLYVEQKRYEEALPHLECAASETPNNIDVLLNWAMALIKTGQTEASLEKLKRVEACDRWNPQVHFLLGTHYMGTEDYPKAAEHLKKTLQEQPDFIDASINLSLVLCELGDAAEAVRQMRPVVRQTQDDSPNAARIYFVYGLVLSRAGDFKEALLKLQKARTLEPHYAEPLAGLGEVYLKLNQLPQAEETLRAMLMQHPDSIAALMLLGQVLQQQGKAIEAANVFQEVLNLSPHNWEAACHRAEALLLAEGRPAMDAGYEQALTIAPENKSQALVRMRWADTLVRLGDQHQADVMIKTARKLQPDIDRLHAQLSR